MVSPDPEGTSLTTIEMRFRRKWKVGRPPDQKRYQALFNRVWDRYVGVMEAEYRHHLGE
jgi:hypothetical protein